MSTRRRHAQLRHQPGGDLGLLPVVAQVVEHLTGNQPLDQHGAAFRVVSQQTNGAVAVVCPQGCRFGAARDPGEQPEAGARALSGSRRHFLVSSLSLAAFPFGTRGAAVSRRRDVPWLAEVQTPPAVLPANAPRLPFLGSHDLKSWTRRRVELRRLWTAFLGTLKCKPPRPTLTVVEEDRPEGCIRQLVRYEAERIIREYGNHPSF